MSESEEQTNESENFDEEQDVIDRTAIILEQSTQLFNRLENNIFALKSRVITFFAILIATITLQFTLLQIILSSLNYGFQTWYLLLIIPFGPLLYAGYLIFRLFWSTEYDEIEMFEKKRMDEVLGFEKKALLSDFLYYIKKCYEKNYEKHSHEIKLFKQSIILFVIGNVLFIIFISILILKKCNMV